MELPKSQPGVFSRAALVYVLAGVFVIFLLVSVIFWKASPTATVSRDDRAVEKVREYQRRYPLRYAGSEYTEGVGIPGFYLEKERKDGSYRYYLVDKARNKRNQIALFTDRYPESSASEPRYTLFEEGVIFLTNDLLGYNTHQIVYSDFACSRQKIIALPPEFQFSSSPVLRLPYILGANLKSLFIYNLATGEQNLFRILQGDDSVTQITIQGVALEGDILYWEQFHDFSSQLDRGYKQKLSLQSSRKVSCAQLDTKATWRKEATPESLSDDKLVIGAKAIAGALQGYHETYSEFPASLALLQGSEYLIHLIDKPKLENYVYSPSPDKQRYHLGVTLSQKDSDWLLEAEHFDSLKAGWPNGFEASADKKCREEDTGAACYDLTTLH